MTSCQVLRPDVLTCCGFGLSEDIGKTEPKQIAFYLKWDESLFVKPSIS